MKKPIAKLLEKLIKFADLYRRDLMRDLPKEFGMVVDDVQNYQVDKGIETGVIISGKKRFGYRITDSSKSHWQIGGSK